MFFLVLVHYKSKCSGSQGHKPMKEYLQIQSHIGRLSMDSSTARREGGSLWLSAQSLLPQMHIASLPSLATAVSSLDTAYSLWKPGNLSRSSLREYVGNINLDPFFSRSLKFQDLNLSCMVSSHAPTSSDAGLLGSGVATFGMTEELTRCPIWRALQRG